MVDQTPPPLSAPLSPAAPRLLDAMRELIRRKHYSLRTEEIYTHVLNRGGRGVLSPLDRIDPKSPA